MEKLRTRMDRWITAPSRTGDKAEPPLSRPDQGAGAWLACAGQVSGMREIFFRSFWVWLRVFGRGGCWLAWVFGSSNA